MDFTEFVFNVLNKLDYFAIPASLLLSIIIAIIGVLPSVFVTGANILLFGPLYGFTVSLLGEVLGAVVSFYIYRAGFSKGFENLNYPIIKKILNASNKKVGIFILQARLLPFMPSGIVTFAASVSKINIGTFTVATILGKIPSISLEALISYDIINLSENWLRLVLTLIAVIPLLFITKRKF